MFPSLTPSLPLSLPSLPLFPSSLQTLLRGTDSWSVSELAHALVVMAHFHSLSSFALGCGLTPEIDTSHEFVISEGADFPTKAPSTLTNPALGLGRRRENSDSETAQSDSEPVSPETTSPPADSKTGQYMVQYFLNSKLDPLECFLMLLYDREISY